MHGKITNQEKFDAFMDGTSDLVRIARPTLEGDVILIELSCVNNQSIMHVDKSHNEFSTSDDVSLKSIGFKKLKKKREVTMLF